MNRTITSTTDLYCIFGSPVRHSLSPVMHNCAFESLDIDAVYLAFDPPSIEEAVSSMRTLSIRGASITIPFKIDVMHHCDDLDDLAAKIGSVNTLTNINGRITGYNTDGYGALLALEKTVPGIEQKHILMLGNGGSARAIAFTLLSRGAGITLAGRSIDRVQSLARDLSAEYGRVTAITLDQLDHSIMEKIDIVINTTSVGMSPLFQDTPIESDLLSDRHTVFDIVYKPDMTRLLSEAAGRGCTIIKGIEMLLYQGIRQFEIWTGRPAPVAIMKQALEQALRAVK